MIGQDDTLYVGDFETKSVQRFLPGQPASLKSIAIGGNPVWKMPWALVAQKQAATQLG